jgi:hypothetical protein
MRKSHELIYSVLENMVNESKMRMKTPDAEEQDQYVNFE